MFATTLLNKAAGSVSCIQHAELSLRDKIYAQRANAIASAMRVNRFVPIANGGKSAASIRQRLLSFQKLLAYDNPAACHYLRLNSRITGRRLHATPYQHGLLVLHAYNRPQRKSHSRTSMCYTSSSHSRLSTSPHVDQTARNRIPQLQTTTMNAP